MNTQGILTFLTIAETKSLSKASEQLHLTQSSVSHRLKSLEDEIGFQLINRKQGQRFIALTPKGEEFIAIAERQLLLNRELSQLHNTDSCKLVKIGCVDTVNSIIFPGFYKQLLNSIPNIRLNISTHWSFTIYDLVERRDIDVGFVLKKIQSRNVLYEPVFEERMVLAYNPDFAEFGDTIHPSKLDTSNEIFLNWYPEYQNWHDYWFSQFLPAIVNVDTWSLMGSFLANSCFWTIVPVSVARFYQKQYKFKFAELLDPPSKRTCFKVTHFHLTRERKSVLQQFENVLNQFRESPEFVQKTG